MTRKQIKQRAARFPKVVEWSEEDKCFIGRCPELMLGGVHGNDEAKVYAELRAAVEEMIELIHADGQEMPHPAGNKGFSGKFVLPPSSGFPPVSSSRGSCLAAKAKSVLDSGREQHQ
jgi:predicted RNase H-like HicB family nuclease